MKKVWTELPMCECPYCGEISQIEDYYDLVPGMEFDCPKCEKGIQILNMDTTITVEVATQPGHE